ncbi:MAG: hypothetical protein E4H03_11585, partial [Myxococcales bacterium]
MTERRPRSIGSLARRAGHAGIGCLVGVLGWSAVALAQTGVVRIELPAAASAGDTITAEIFVDITDPTPPDAALGAYTIDLNCTPAVGSPVLEIVSPALGGVQGGTTSEFSGPPSANQTAPCELRLGGINFSSLISPTGLGISVARVDIKVLPTALAGEVGNVAVLITEVRDTAGILIPSTGQGGSVTVDSCTVDANCSDGDACNGAETCNAGICQSGTPLTCDDGLFCNGAETCSATLGCQAGTAPNCNDGVGCTGDSCNEGTNVCDHVANNGSCDDGLFCNGAETCSVTLDCQAGTAPNCSDGVGCTDDSCNEGT